jgi:hypothetical protein
MFFRCDCGKIHLVSVLADFCPRCGLDLRFRLFRSGRDRRSVWNGEKYVAVK